MASRSSVRGRDHAGRRHRVPACRATAVGVGTALFYDPLILPRINSGITDYLSRHGLDHVSQLTGALQLNTARPTPLCGC